MNSKTQHITAELPADLPAPVAEWLAAANPRQLSQALAIGASAILAAGASAPAPGPELPATTGRRGEEAVLSILRDKYPDLTDVSRVPKSGDMSLITGGGRVIIEVKNYSRDVPSAQVDKFIRDIYASNAVAALMISLNTAITGVPGPVHIGRIYDGRPIHVIYCASSAMEVIAACADMAVGLAASGTCTPGLELVEAADELVRLRVDYQEEVCRAMTKMMTHGSKLAAACVRIRGLVGKSCAGVTIAEYSSDIITARLRDCFSKYPKEHSYICDIIGAITAINPNDTVWRVTNTAVTHGTGLSFHLGRTLTVSIPAAGVPGEVIIDAVRLYGGKVDKKITVAVNSDTITYILEVIGKVQAC